MAKAKFRRLKMKLPYQRCLIKEKLEKEKKRYVIVSDEDRGEIDAGEKGIIVERKEVEGFETLDKAIEYAEEILHYSKDEIFVQLSIY